MVKDICDILEYKNLWEILSRYVKDTDKGLTICETLGGAQNMTLITQEGVLRIMIK